MDVWWFAPVVVLALSGVVLLVAAAVARRSTAELAADRPALEALGVEVVGLHADVRRLSARVETSAGGASVGTADR